MAWTTKRVRKLPLCAAEPLCCFAMSSEHDGFRRLNGWLCRRSFELQRQLAVIGLSGLIPEIA